MSYAAAVLFACLVLAGCGRRPVVVASKKFTESCVLGDIAQRRLEQAGLTVDNRQAMGATSIVWQALSTGQITAYPEYSATITQQILKLSGTPDTETVRKSLAAYGVGMTDSLGFIDNYALVMTRKRAAELHISKISDLRGHPDLVVRTTNEFLKREDGWAPLSKRYGLAMTDVAGMEHELGYTALADGKIDVKDCYTTDPQIAELDLVVLDDDLAYFPKYQAVFLYRLDAPPKAVDTIKKLAGTINQDLMIRMNGEAQRTKHFEDGAALYFGGQSKHAERSMAADIASWTGQHLFLVAVSMVITILIGVPLGIVASRPGRLSQVVLGATGVVQTIPSIALLTMLIPRYGIGTRTAIIALVLYSLLPIVRNTATGLQNIPGSLRDSATALGMEPSAQLIKIYLPLASPSILAGIKTSAVINVGTATLAAFIGAGGLGQPIVSGLALNDTNLELEGAIPAACLALIVQFAFTLVDRLLIPQGLRLPERRD